MVGSPPCESLLEAGKRSVQQGKVLGRNASHSIVSPYYFYGLAFFSYLLWRCVRASSPLLPAGWVFSLMR